VSCSIAINYYHYKGSRQLGFDIALKEIVNNFFHNCGVFVKVSKVVILISDVKMWACNV
jgi:hypothetical protein